MSLLEEKVKGLEFLLVEDADGEEYGEGTWSNAVAMVKALAGDGFTLIRRNRNRVRLAVCIGHVAFLYDCASSPPPRCTALLM